VRYQDRTIKVAPITKERFKQVATGSIRNIVYREEAPTIKKGEEKRTRPML